MVRGDDKKGISLAIGDGANDVNMITAAHIGVGIRGLEGQQAARASDYSITEFKHLNHLLFVHGRESTRKNGYTICYCFYKNMIVVMPIFWFGFYSGFSGQTIYNQWQYQLYNTIFTALPICIFAIFDKQYEREELLSNPKLYTDSLKGTYIYIYICIYIYVCV